MDSTLPSNSLASVQDFYLQQQHWVASQKQSSLIQIETLPLETSLQLATADWAQAFVAHHFQQRSPVPSHSKLKQRHRRLAARRLSLRAHSPRLIVAARFHHQPPTQTISTQPSSATTKLLDMFENIVSSRVESCKRLEAIVQEAEQRKWY